MEKFYEFYLLINMIKLIKKLIKQKMECLLSATFKF